MQPRAEIGVQSYTYRQFDVPAMAEELKGTGVRAVELWNGQLGPDATPAAVASARAALADAGLRVCGFGVCSLGSQDPQALERTLQFAAGLGAAYVSLDVPPNDEAGKAMLVEAARKSGLLLAIHNHGPGHHYAAAEQVLESCREHDERLGACLDTGHYMRAGQDPVEAIRILGPRVHAVHLKDFTEDGREVVPGTARLDYGALLAALKAHTRFAGPYVIEYEANPDEPTPVVREAVELFLRALEA